MFQQQPAAFGFFRLTLPAYSDDAAGLGHDMCRISQYKRSGHSRASSSNDHPFQNAAKYIIDTGKLPHKLAMFLSILRTDGDNRSTRPPIQCTTACCFARWGKI